MDQNRYYVLLRGKTRGPYSIEQLRRLVSRGQFSRMYQISTDKLTWASASELHDVFATVQPVPSGPKSQPFSFDEQWYYASGDQRLGPLARDELLMSFSGGHLPGSTLVWREGLSDWLPAEIVFAESISSTPGRKSKALPFWATLSLLLVAALGIGTVLWWQNEGRKPQQIARNDVSVAATVGDAKTPNVVDSVPVPADVKPVEVKPAELKPDEVKPDETKPVEVKDNSGDVKKTNAVNAVAESGEIRSVEVKDKSVVSVINDSVGMVGLYLSIDMHDGARHEKWMGNGSCFLVNRQGHAITNRHVVKEHKEWLNATGKGRIERLVRALLSSADLTDSVTKKQIAAMEKRMSRIAKITPHCVVYFAGKGFPADVHYVSSRFDMAVLTIEGLPPSPWFALSADNECPQTSPVFAFGFPGTSQEAVADSEKAFEMARQLGSSIDDLLFGTDDHRNAIKSGSFEVSTTSGEVEQIQEETGGIVHAKHSARISWGNSGGPLVLREGKPGTVFGINTQYIPKGVAPVPVAFPIAQMKKELEQDAKVPDLNWR
ncbi:MAG: serine endoprotease [Schlesneria sp.]|nr:serine endoprotease [Schlesneria sp.]